MTDSNGANGRDVRGRFQKGCRPGPGNPAVRRIGEAQEAIRRAVTPIDIGSVLAKLRDQALAGDVAAAKVFLDRTLGKATRPTGAFAVELPEINDAASAAAAMRSILAALAKGDLDPEAAGRALGLVRSISDALVLAGIESRIEAIEQERE